MSDHHEHLLIKRGLYYRPDSAGYTGKKSDAGRYPADYADGYDEITAVHQDEAPEYAPACWQETIIADLRAQLETAKGEVERLSRVIKPRPFDEWFEDYSDVLWHLMPIAEAPFCGSPLATDWPYDEVDEARLWWTPLPDCNAINQAWAARTASLEGVKA